jgi:DNA (cytosine-5)-methyltransferase 1
MAGMKKPLLLDLFCCQGGASAGYVAAGFDVVGVDLAPQPRYPYRFYRWNALTFLEHYMPALKSGVMASAIHASPPCQGRTNAQKIQKRDHPKLIGQTRDLLAETGLPYVIENVPLMAGVTDDDPMKNPVALCGAMFGLHTYRHRLFETNFDLGQPEHPEHTHQQVKMGRPVREGEFYQAVGNFSNVEYARRDMGVPWMSRDGIRECIPPAYTLYVGNQLREVL